MKKYIYSFLLFSFMILASCQNEEMVTPKDAKLDYYVESYDMAGLGFTPQLKVVYEYNEEGNLSRFTFFSYNPDSESFEELRYFDFSYADGKVDKIKGYLPGADNHYIEDLYQYSSDSRVSKITENNYGTGINSEANFTYNDTNESVKVAYTFSNGGSFEYEFNYNNENILSDKTTRGEQLCSTGEYRYDDHKNPFKELGYVDFLLTNISANNKLTEDVDYVGCAFPSLIPESYEYEYNELGYPTVSTTNYNSQGGVKSQKQFFYK